MRAVSLRRPGELLTVSLAEPAHPAPDEALVRVLRVGICGTDLHAFKGEQPMMAYPVVLGHELAVEVLALGSDAAASPARVGDRCTVVPYLHCGYCATCRRGLTNCCENLRVLGVHVDGGLRERFTLRARHLLPANDLSDDALALTEMLAIGSHAVQRAGVTKEDAVVVVGLGPIGLGTVVAAREQGATVVGVDTSAARLAAAARLVTAEPVEAGAGLEARLAAALGGQLPTVVLDATGNAASMQHAPNLAAPGGRVVLIGHTAGTLTFDNQAIHRKELTLAASRNATPADFRRVLAWSRAQGTALDAWVNARTDLAGVVNELPAWSEGPGAVMKAMVDVA